jgi:hypothetical protein
LPRWAELKKEWSMQDKAFYKTHTWNTKSELKKGST